MSEILFHYRKIDPTTWAYLSSLLMICVFFKFNRFWSVRNLDLVLLILFAPGLLRVNQSRQARSVVVVEAAASARAGSATLSAAIPLTAAEVALRSEKLRHDEYLGYLWLFVVSAVWLVRMLLDPT